MPGTLASAAAIQGLNAVTGVLLARVLGPHDRGVLAAVLLWPGLVVMVGYFGVSEALTYNAARGVALGRLVGTALSIWLVQSVILAGLGTVVVILALSHLGPGARDAGILYLLLYAPIFLLSDYALRTLQGLGRFGLFNVIRLLLPVTTALLLGGLTALGDLTVHLALIAYLGGYAVIALLGSWLLVRERPTSIRCDLKLAKGLIGYGIRSHVTNISSFMNLRLDQLVISLFLPATQLGLYVVAVTVTSAAPLIGSSIAAVALPMIARASDRQERARAAGRYVRLTLGTSALITIPLLGLAPQILDAFFGREFSSVAGVARILMVGAIFIGLSQALRAVLMGVGYPLDAGKSELIALLVTVPGLALLLPALGLDGAALVSLLAYAVSAGWSVRRVGHRIEVPVRHILIRPRASTMRAVGAPVGGDA